jgi:GNAT superfamily N-acetyltransferase
MSVGAQVRLLAEPELPALHMHLPVWNGREYARRLSYQERGLAVQLVAWDGGRPVGRAMLVLPGHPEWSWSAHREICPEIRDLEVLPASRGRGVGGALIRDMETAASDAGSDRIGLMVGDDDASAPARSLYERLGYTFAHGPFVSSARLYADDGSTVAVAGVCRYLVKPLPTRRQLS